MQIKLGLVIAKYTVGRLLNWVLDHRLVIDTATDHTLMVMAIIEHIAEQFELLDSEVYLRLTRTINSKFVGKKNFNEAANILYAETPGKAFISAIVRNGEWTKKHNTLIEYDFYKQLLNTRTCKR